MTKYLLIAFALVALAACQSSEEEEKKGLSPRDIKNPNTLTGEVDSIFPKISFEETHFDFGTVEQGEVVTHRFEFTNTGNDNLIIRNATSTCGCTISEFPREPVAPGESDFILVEFDSEGRANKVMKTVNITANTVPNINKLTIEAFVKTE